MEAIRGLSLIQPWASLMAIGAKQFETRGWRHPYTGLVAIHASKGYPGWAKEYTEDLDFQDALERGGVDPNNLPLQSILAVGRLVGYYPTHEIAKRIGPEERLFGDYSAGRWALKFEDVRALPQPIKVNGSLKFWELEPALAAQLVEFYQGGLGRG